MSSYTGQEFEDLVFALKLLGVEPYPDFASLPDTTDNLAVGPSQAQVLGSLQDVKEWIRRADGTPVKWYAVDHQMMASVDSIIRLVPREGFQDKNVDTDVLCIDDWSLAHLFIDLDLGGQNIGKPPIRSLFWIEHLDRQRRYPGGRDLHTRVWISRDAGALLDMSSSDLKEMGEVAEYQGRPYHVVEPGVISPNTAALVLRRLSRPVPAAAATEEDDNQAISA